MAAHVVQITRSELAELSTSSSPTISDTKSLASYSWIETSTPTIAVPGLPPLWSPPEGPQKVNKDSGLVYIAQNAARHPQSPIEPLFRALFIMHPEFDVRSVDVITDRNNMRKLLDFIQPGRDNRREESFAINVEIVGETMMLGRTETKTVEFIHPRDFRGYGHEFERRYTKSEIPKATGHHQIVSYSFCGMKFIIRYEADGHKGFSPKEKNNDTKEGKDPREESKMKGETGVQKEKGLSDLLEKLTLDPTSEEPYTTFPGSALKVRLEGREIPFTSTLEIKTRYEKKRIQFGEVAPQLWVSQTQHLVRAYHKDGTFSEPKVENVSQQLRDWEKARKAELKQLGALIQWIADAVKGLGGKATVQYGGGKGALTVHKRFGAEAMLPKDLHSKWEVVGEDSGSKGSYDE